MLSACFFRITFDVRCHVYILYLIISCAHSRFLFANRTLVYGITLRAFSCDRHSVICAELLCYHLLLSKLLLRFLYPLSDSSKIIFHSGVTQIIGSLDTELTPNLPVALDLNLIFLFGGCSMHVQFCIALLFIFVVV